MFHDFARDDEIEFPEFMFGRIRQIESRLAIVERVAIIQFPRELGCILIRVGHAQTSQTLHSREFRDRKLDPEQFHRQHQHQSTCTDAGPTTRATRRFRGPIANPPGD